VQGDQMGQFVAKSHFIKSEKITSFSGDKKGRFWVRENMDKYLLK